ncbi:MAG: translation initiation factor IF-2 [Candidatus Diapherotrites archaeon]
MIRQPIIVVLGHVDAGKTKILDAIRGTAIAEKEAGGITQHIGATEVPIGTIRKLSGALIEKYKFNIGIPGLLFIDTPGHEAFANLRKRGGSIADLAVLVVDVNKGLQQQTNEAIEVLKSYKTPFIIAQNKIDTIRGWQNSGGAVSDSMQKQRDDVLEELDTKTYELIGAMHKKGFRCERFDRVKDFTKEIPIVPVCAKSGDGVPEVLMFLAGLSQKYLDKRLHIEESAKGRGTVLEVKEEKGLGKTVDVILYDGVLKIGDEIVLAGKNGVISTKVRALLVPKPLQEIRNPQDKFSGVEGVVAASGVKIAAPMLEDALAGSPLLVKYAGSEEEVMKEVLGAKIDTEAVGPVVKADALGSLEAVVKLLEGHGIKVRKADIGEVSKRDVMEAEAVRSSDRFKGIVFAFNVKVDAAAGAEAKKSGVKVFSEKIIYRLIEGYDEWLAAERESAKEEKLQHAVMPVKLKVLPGCIFHNTKPAIVGVRILAGRLKNGVELMKKGGEKIGKVQGMQDNGKDIDEAKQGQEVAVSIKGATCGRNLFENDELYSFLPARQLERLGEMGDALSEGEMELVLEIKKMAEIAVEVGA